MTDIAVINCTTGDVVVRPMTDDEQTRHAAIIDTPAPPDPLTDMQAQLAAQQALIDQLLDALGGKP